MRRFFVYLILSVLISFGAVAKTIDQKKEELKKIYEAGGISKVEYEKSIEFLEKPEEKNKKIKKQSFSLKKKKNKIKNKNIFKNEDEDLEKITLKKIDELGKISKHDKSIYPKSMLKKFKGCGKGYKCSGQKAGQILYKTFTASKSFGQRNPGKMIQAMAMYEVFYASKLYDARKSIQRFRDNKYKNKKGIFGKKKDDEKKIRSLIGMNNGRKNMREALGMSLETPKAEAIKKFWLLGEFLDLGTGVKYEKLDKDLKERQELLEAYKLQIANLKKKLQDDIDEKEKDNEKSVE